jgi:hypothetical protein
MLEVGKKRASGIGFTSADLSWQEGDAQALPFEDNTFDAYTISFGIRNVVDVQKVILVVCSLFYYLTLMQNYGLRITSKIICN